MSTVRPDPQHAGEPARPPSGEPDGRADADEPVGDLVARASRQMSQLVREEMKLAQAELAESTKRYSAGGGLFGGAGFTAVLAVMALVTAGIAALSLVLPVWASALIAAGVLGAVAALLGAQGKKQVGKGGSPVPQQAIDGVKADIDEIKERAKR